MDTSSQQLLDEIFFGSADDEGGLMRTVLLDVLNEFREADVLNDLWSIWCHGGRCVQLVFPAGVTGNSFASMNLDMLSLAMYMLMT